MRSVRKLALLGLVGLMVCAVLASAGSAATVENAATGAAYTGGIAGTNVSGVTLSTNWVGTVSCTSSTMSGTIASNNPVTGSITSATWTGGGSGWSCTSNLGDCTVTAADLPWRVDAVVGSMTLSAPAGYAGVTVVCGTGSCTFARSWVDLALTNGTATTDLSAYANVALSLQSGSIFTCGTSATLTATYALWGTSGGHIPLKVV